jgi:uncharacterized protein
MGKIAIWILVIIAIMLVLRLIASKKGSVDGSGDDRKGGSTGRPGSRSDAEPRGNAGELMMSCAVCGVHLPASEAVFGHGKVFCGAEHRDADEARRDGA